MSEIPFIEAIIIKIVILGCSNVGKTALMNRYCCDTFVESSRQSTIGSDFRTKSLKIHTIPVIVQVWDTAGRCSY